MIISNLTGGLGNQMFQYAFGRKIASKNNTTLKLHFTNALFNTQYEYGLGIFTIKAHLATAADLKQMNASQNRFINRTLYLIDERFGIQFNKHIVTQKYPYKFYADDLLVPNNSYLQGFWADMRYFEGIENNLKKEFTLKNKLDSRNQKILSKIKNTNSISIHVRRGDFVTNKRNAAQFIGLDYYINSIKKIKKMTKDPVYFVFSNDISWCRKHLSRYLKNAHFVNHNNTLRTSYKDLILMSMCKHNIIANSTFSWWAGWLNSNKNKILISPPKTL